MPAHDIDFRSLCIATDVDVLPESADVVERDRYVVVRTPSNPTYHWGNYLVYPEPPTRGCREQWEADFQREITDRNEGSTHVAFAWDRIDGAEGDARDEFGGAGYDVERVVGLTATIQDLRAHARASGDAVVRALDPNADEVAWAAVLELEMGNREPEHSEAGYREFLRTRMNDRLERFRVGDGSWYGAWIDGELAGSLGIVVTHGRARYQAVDTSVHFRRRGVARRLVFDAAVDAAARFDIDHFVIGAVEDYHALPLYTSLGFVPAETVACASWWPSALRAHQHPTFTPASSCRGPGAAASGTGVTRCGQRASGTAGWDDAVRDVRIDVFVRDVCGGVRRARH